MAVLWDDLDLEMMKRISELKLPAIWNFIVQSMANNFLYSIRKAVEDGIKDKEKFKTYTNHDKKEEELIHN